jgi:hypothetical protein
MAMKRVIGKKHFEMVPPQVAKVKGEDPQTKAFAEMENVFSAAANIDAIKIFYTAKTGISNSTQAINELGLTQKRYYTHLKRLIDAGLVEKTDGIYQHTTLGKISCKLGEIFIEALSHNEHLSLIDKVRQSGSLSIKEKEEVIQAVSKSNLVNFLDLLSGDIRSVGIVTKFKDIVVGVERLLEKAEKEVYLATRYTDPGVNEAVLNTFERGIKMYLLDGDRKDLSQKIQLMRLVLSHPRMIKTFYSLFRSPNVSTGYVDNLPYSFIVVDDKYVGVEVPKPDSDEFFVALFFENELFAKKLKEVFNTLATKAKEDPLKGISEELSPKIQRFSS